jgi:hypothetical protein
MKKATADFQTERRAVLTASLASTFADLALAGVGREWPHAYQHLAQSPADVRSPRSLHPAFFGCYDWHSSVHGHWTLARILRLFPTLPSAARIRASLDQNLSKDHLMAELAYFESPGHGTFERPYGWGWLLALAAELREGREPCTRRWSVALRPLEKFIARSLCDYLPRLPYPIRSGVHSNTAFAMSFALDYARKVGYRQLEATILARSRDFFGADVDAPVKWEPSGEDFFSPSLTEADLMARVLAHADFKRWLARFLPGLTGGKRSSITMLPRVLDRLDPRQVHLDGLCLSRAWAFQRIASKGPVNGKLLKARENHAQAGLARVSSGDYGGEHWLASFAVYLLTSTSES